MPLSNVAASKNLPQPRKGWGGFKKKLFYITSSFEVQRIATLTCRLNFFLMLLLSEQIFSFSVSLEIDNQVKKKVSSNNRFLFPSELQIGNSYLQPQLTKRRKEQNTQTHSPNPPFTPKATLTPRTLTTSLLLHRKRHSEHFYRMYLLTKKTLLKHKCLFLLRRGTLVSKMIPRQVSVAVAGMRHFLRHRSISNTLTDQDCQGPGCPAFGSLVKWFC